MAEAEWTSAGAAALAANETVRQRQIEWTTKKMALLRERKRTEAARHQIEVKSIEAEWCEIQRHCVHPKTTYFPDAAGGSDSSTQCDLCHVEL